MANSLPIAKIGDIAMPIERPEVPLAGTTYRQIGVRLWGVGAYERESIDGSQTKYATLSRMESGDIIVNKIWARNGSVAVVSDELAGCFGSGEFPTFAPNREKLDPKWFHWITKTKWFWAACDEKSQGTSGKNRIRPEKLLDIEIPLPPLTEQRRIVARIETLAARVAQAQSLRREASEEADKLLGSAVDNVLNGYRENLLPLKTIIVFHKAGTWGDNPIPGQDMPVIRSTEFINGSIAPKSAARRTVQISENEKLRDGDLLVIKSSGSERLVGEVAFFQMPNNHETYTYSNFIHLLRPDIQKVLPRFLWYAIRSPHQKSIVIEMNRTTSGLRNLKMTDFLEMGIPVPPLEEQRRLVAYLDGLQAQVSALRAAQAETERELSALMPSVLDRAFKGEL